MGYLRSLVLFLGLLSSAHADPSKVAVDVELVLAADVSSSMDIEERQAQVDGYANAFRDEALLASLLSGATGRIAVTYVEWSEEQHVIVPWTLIANVDDAQRFAAAIAGALVYRDPHGTNLTAALRFSEETLFLNQFAGTRRVIDISGDGENNIEPPPDAVRDAIVREGITINGLSLEILPDKKKDWRNGPTTSYYAAHVIGGPGAFLLSMPIRSRVESSPASPPLGRPVKPSQTHSEGRPIRSSFTRSITVTEQPHILNASSPSKTRSRPPCR